MGGTHARFAACLTPFTVMLEDLGRSSRNAPQEILNAMSSTRTPSLPPRPGPALNAAPAEAALALRTWARLPAKPGLVSIVVPAFNAAGFLPLAVDSVRAQTYSCWELVVVDDGSTDDTRGVAERLAARDPRIHVVHQRNLGPAAARNRGLIECFGELVQYLDADDKLCPDKLARQVAFLSDHPDIDIVTGDSLYFDHTGARRTELEPPPPAANWRADLLLRNVTSINSPLTRRRLIAEIGAFKECNARGERVLCEDWDFWLRAALAGAELAYVPGAVVHNRWHGGNLMGDRVRLLRWGRWVLEDNARNVPLRSKPLWAIGWLEKHVAVALAIHPLLPAAHPLRRRMLAWLHTARAALLATSARPLDTRRSVVAAPDGARASVSRR
jgi:glycosyltransferase involved in cell wall biosynthesis